MDTVEHTVFISREVNVFKIPPRPAAGGHKSGEWKVADKIFTGRLRVTAVGETCELRLEDSNTSELFGVCPVAKGQRQVAVEPVSDSSRYFVLRLLDKATGRHAFVGLGFTDRGEAFDFNVALSDHEKQSHRASAAESSGGPSASWASKEIAALDTGKDFSLKEGETIRVNVKKPAVVGNGIGFLSSQLSTGSKLPLAAILGPPPSAAPARTPPGNVPSSATPHPQQQRVQAQPAQEGYDDLLGMGTQSSAAPARQPAPAQFQSNKVPDSWASFD